MAIIVPVAITLPLTVAILRYKYLSPALRFFIIYLVLNGAGNLCASILAYRRINNLPVLHVYTVLEFVLISFFYKKILRTHIPAKVINAIVYTFIAFCIINTSFFQPIYSYNSYSRAFSCIIIMGYALYCFKHALDAADGDDGERQIPLWINAALLLYFGGSLFLFISANLILSDSFMNTIFWTIHATLVLIMYFLFTMGFLNAGRNR